MVQEGKLTFLTPNTSLSSGGRRLVKVLLRDRLYGNGTLLKYIKIPPTDIALISKRDPK